VLAEFRTFRFEPENRGREQVIEHKTNLRSSIFFPELGLSITNSNFDPTLIILALLSSGFFAKNYFLNHSGGRKGKR